MSSVLQARSQTASSLVAAVAVCAPLVVALLAEPALAWRPPAKTLIDWAMKRQVERATRSLRVEVETRPYDRDGAPVGTSVERYVLMAPGSVRIESDGPDGQTVELRVDGRAITRAPGAAEKAGKAPVDVFFDAVTAGAPLDEDRAAERMLRGLKSLGVNTEVVSLSRFDGRVVWVIGAKPWDKDKPQVWLDKESLLVVRVVTLQKGEGQAVARVDQRYLGWGSPVGGNWFPATIEVWVDDRLMRRSVVRSVDRNVSVDAATFR